MTFLDLYCEYTKKQESPLEFHLWTAITILASALGRKCFFNKGYYRLYPNLFTVLVAGSARCRKSTAIGLGIQILREVPTTRVFSGKITPEKFLAELAPDGEAAPPNLIVHSSELSVFMTKQQYGEPLIYMLTDLYDCPDVWEYKTKNKGETILREVFLTILAATTPDGIASGIPGQVMKEGFASRVLWVYKADTDRRNALPELSEEERAMREQLIMQIQDRAKYTGEFTLSPDARDWYVSWYNAMEPPADKRLEGMFGRKHDHLLRLGMVFAASEGRMIIEPSDLDAGMMCLDTIEVTAPQAFRGLGGDERTPFAERILAYLRAKKRVTYSELLRAAYPCRADAFKEIMETICLSGYATRDPEKNHMFVVAYPAEETES